MRRASQRSGTCESAEVSRRPSPARLTAADGGGGAPEAASASAGMRAALFQMPDQEGNSRHCRSSPPAPGARNKLGREVPSGGQKATTILPPLALLIPSPSPRLEFRLALRPRVARAANHHLRAGGHPRGVGRGALPLGEAGNPGGGIEGGGGGSPDLPGAAVGGRDGGGDGDGAGEGVGAGRRGGDARRLHSAQRQRTGAKL